MQIILRKPRNLSCDSAATWAWYGASQALGMLGVTYDQRPDAAGLREPYLIIDPARGQISLNCLPGGRADDLRAEQLCAVTYAARFSRPEAEPQVLPLLGPVRRPLPGASVGEVIELADPDPGEGLRNYPLLTVQAEEPRTARFSLVGRVFETIGLYLSRFSWPGDPGFKTFVREIDDLWDGQLRERWGQTAVVNDYVQIIAGLLCQLHAQVGEPLVTVWPHPFRDGQVKRQGFLVSHDVDQLFDDPARRTELEQWSNPRWFLPRWREFESELNVRSAHYFYSPKPGDKYWFEPNYSPSDPPVLAEMKTLLAGGWEVSLHQMSHESEAEVRGEVEFLLQTLGLESPTGTRSHYLKHTFDTLSYKAAAGLRYDSTWYAEQTTSGMLCGAVLPYRPLDCRTAEPVGLWEFPFVIEDGNVFGVYGQGTGRDTAGAVEDGKTILDLALAHDGFVCFNWHQQTFTQMSGYPGVADCWPPAMAGLIRYLRDQSNAVWNPLPIELADWCSRREAIRVTTDGRQVQVQNAGATDCPDLVLCYHLPAGKDCPLDAIGRDVPAQAQYLGTQGSRCLYAVPVAVAAGDTTSVRVPV